MRKDIRELTAAELNEVAGGIDSLATGVLIGTATTFVSYLGAPPKWDTTGVQPGTHTMR